MIGKINPDGELLIKRSGKWIKQKCPFRVADVNSFGISCSHECPLFYYKKEEKDRHGKETQTVRICQDRVLFFDELSDERG